MPRPNQQQKQGFRRDYRRISIYMEKVHGELVEPFDQRGDSDSNDWRLYRLNREAESRGGLKQKRFD